MGMSLRTLEALTAMRAGHLLDDLQAVCDIGATETQFHGHVEPVRSFLEAFGGSLELSGETVEKLAEKGYANELWRACGIEYLAIDTSLETPTLNLDLNFDAVPPDHRGRYQLITNFGTTEHVCNQLNAMKVIHDLCAPGGKIYHVVPFSGYQNHGFFRYNAKFFWKLCRSNAYDYRDLTVELAETSEPLHPDIMVNMERFGHDLARIAHFSTVEGVLRVLLRKPDDRPFRPPFDGRINTPDGIPPSYHTVFRDAA
jgi:hypothetical protein